MARGMLYNPSPRRCLPNRAGDHQREKLMNEKLAHRHAAPRSTFRRAFLLIRWLFRPTGITQPSIAQSALGYVPTPCYYDE
jgi:hypothetical protein